MSEAHGALTAVTKSLDPGIDNIENDHNIGDDILENRSANVNRS